MNDVPNPSVDRVWRRSDQQVLSISQKVIAEYNTCPMIVWHRLVNKTARTEKPHTISSIHGKAVHTAMEEMAKRAMNKDERVVKRVYRVRQAHERRRTEVKEKVKRGEVGAQALAEVEEEEKREMAELLVALRRDSLEEREEANKVYEAKLEKDLTKQAAKRPELAEDLKKDHEKEKIVKQKALVSKYAEEVQEQQRVEIDEDTGTLHRAASEVLGAEVHAVVRLGHLGVAIVGEFDRVDLRHDAKTGKDDFVVVEIKSGSGGVYRRIKPNKNATVMDLLAHRSFQMPVYLWLFEVLTGIRPRGEVHLINNRNRLTFTMTDLAFKEITNIILLSVEGILSGFYAARPSHGACSQCIFSRNCRHVDKDVARNLANSAKAAQAASSRAPVAEAGAGAEVGAGATAAAEVQSSAVFKAEDGVVAGAGAGAGAEAEAPVGDKDKAGAEAARGSAAAAPEPASAPPAAPPAPHFFSGRVRIPSPNAGDSEAVRKKMEQEQEAQKALERQQASEELEKILSPEMIAGLDPVALASRHNEDALRKAQMAITRIIDEEPTEVAVPDMITKLAQLRSLRAEKESQALKLRIAQRKLMRR